MTKKNLTVNFDELDREQSMFFVRGTNRGNRKYVARRLARIFNFPGGFRAAYRAVKKGYTSCDLYAGPVLEGGFGINAHLGIK